MRGPEMLLLALFVLLMIIPYAASDSFGPPGEPPYKGGNYVTTYLYTNTSQKTVATITITYISQGPVFKKIWTINGSVFDGKMTGVATYITSKNMGTYSLSFTLWERWPSSTSTHLYVVERTTYITTSSTVETTIITSSTHDKYLYHQPTPYNDGDISLVSITTIIRTDYRLSTTYKYTYNNGSRLQLGLYHEYTHITEESTSIEWDGEDVLADGTVMLSTKTSTVYRVYRRTTSKYYSSSVNTIIVSVVSSVTTRIRTTRSTHYTSNQYNRWPKIVQSRSTKTYHTEVFHGWWTTSTTSYRWEYFLYYLTYTGTVTYQPIVYTSYITYVTSYVTVYTNGSASSVSVQTVSGKIVMTEKIGVGTHTTDYVTTIDTDHSIATINGARSHIFHTKDSTAVFKEVQLNYTITGVRTGSPLSTILNVTYYVVSTPEVFGATIGFADYTIFTKTFSDIYNVKYFAVYSTPISSVHKYVSGSITFQIITSNENVTTLVIMGTDRTSKIDKFVLPTTMISTMKETIQTITLTVVTSPTKTIQTLTVTVKDYDSSGKAYSTATLVVPISIKFEAKPTSTGSITLNIEKHPVTGGLERTVYSAQLIAQVVLLILLIYYAVMYGLYRDSKDITKIILILVAVFIIKYGPAIVDFINNW